MAKNQHEEQDSGDEVEESSPENAESESESGSGSETEPEPEQPAKKPPVSAPKKPPPHDSSSESEESESESESGSGRPTQQPNVKPISSKPMDTKKSGSKTITTAPTKPSAGTGAKRPAAATAEAESEEGGEKESKRLKKKPEKKVEPLVQKPPNEDVKRQLFQRLWSEDDEIAILKGMIDYKLKKKSDPVGDLNAFHEFIKKSLHVDVSKAQLQDKIRRLKKKYENNAVKERKGKKERTFSKAHEQKAYDLSKKIWGKEKNVVEEVVDRVIENGTGKKGESKSGVLDDGVKEEEEKKKVGDEVENVVEVGLRNLSFLVSCRTSLDAMEKWLEENSGLVSVEKRNEMNGKLSSLKVVEMDLLAKRYQLINEQVSLVSEAMKALEN